MSESKASSDFEIAIIGGGIAGITLALALSERKVRFQIYEQASQFGEIGAGVAFTRNAVEAMKICHPGIHEAFEKVCTRNLWPSKQNVWFDYLDGYGDGQGDEKSQDHQKQEVAFTITNSLGQAGVYRAHFLDELVKLVPSGVAHFGKRLKDITAASAPAQGSGGDGEEKRPKRYKLTFEDGTTAEADAVIGCDGIKSKVREIMYRTAGPHGQEHPCVRPSYSHKYAYRGLIPMDKATEAIGQEHAENACMYMGPGGHMLTFPVNHGRTLNIVAFHTTSEPWTTGPAEGTPGAHAGAGTSGRLTRPATREEALRDFQGYGHHVRALLEMTNPNLDCWAIFHLADHPVPHFNKGGIALSGDAAHATSPHHGAGAGFCIEDSATLATLLAGLRQHHQSQSESQSQQQQLQQQQQQTNQDLDVVFETYDTIRRERGHWLVQSSQFIGNAYEWLAPGCGSDFAKIEAEINRRNAIISDFDVSAMCREAGELLAKNLANNSSSSS